MLIHLLHPDHLQNMWRRTITRYQSTLVTLQTSLTSDHRTVIIVYVTYRLIRLYLIAAGQLTSVHVTNIRMGPCYVYTFVGYRTRGRKTHHHETVFKPKRYFSTVYNNYVPFLPLPCDFGDHCYCVSNALCRIYEVYTFYYPIGWFGEIIRWRHRDLRWLFSYWFIYLVTWEITPWCVG